MQKITMNTIRKEIKKAEKGEKFDVKSLIEVTLNEMFNDDGDPIDKKMGIAIDRLYTYIFFAMIYRDDERMTNEEKINGFDYISKALDDFVHCLVTDAVYKWMINELKPEFEKMIEKESK